MYIVLYKKEWRTTTINLGYVAKVHVGCPSELVWEEEGEEEYENFSNISCSIINSNYG